jgi:DNA repair exonuclease SbcCD nuclease subunit
MAKALLFSDLHLHAHKESVHRLQHCIDTLEWIFDQAVAHDCDHILFLGDLFHERAKIDVLNYLRTFEVFMKRMLVDQPKFDMWLLIGNHDMYHRERWDVNSVKPLTAIPKVHIVDTPSSILFGDVLIDFCPHTENPIRELEKIKESRTKESLRILLGHMAVHGAELNRLYGTRADVIVEYDNDMIPVSVDIFKDWDHVFLGHYHGAQHLNDKVEYLGSPLQLSFGEAFQEKHILILDLETMEKEYVVNTFSPKHLILQPEEVASHDMNNAFVRVEVDDTGNKELIDMQRDIQKKFEVLSFSYKQKDKKMEQDKAVVTASKAMLQNEAEMLQIYMDNHGVPSGMDKTHLLQIGTKCLAKK